MVDAPEKLLDRARRELHTYERVGKQTSSELILALFDAERQIAELRAEWAKAHEADAKAFLAANARAEAAEAERDRLAARLSEYNRWPDPLQSPQAEAIRNGKIDMTEIVSLFDKMERELEQLRFVAADNARKDAALRGALSDQHDLLHACRELANAAPDESVRAVRHIRADRVEERLTAAKAALAGKE